MCLQLIKLRIELAVFSSFTMFKKKLGLVPRLEYRFPMADRGHGQKQNPGGLDISLRGNKYD